MVEVARESNAGASEVTAGYRKVLKSRSIWIERGLIEDVWLAMGQYRLAATLYMAEIAEVRRGTGLGLAGPFVSMLLHVAILGTVMSLVFKEPTVEFIPYFGLSFAVWQSLSTSVARMANASERAIRYVGFPKLSSLLIYVIDGYDYLIGLGTRLVAALIAIMVLDPSALRTAHLVGLLLGLVLTSTIVFVWAPSIAFLFNKFRLLRGFLAQILLMVFLVTPVLYSADRLSDYRWVAEFNPVYHLLEIVRAPVLDGTLPMLSVAVSVGLLLIGVLLLAFVHSRQRVAMIYGWVA